MKKGWHWTVRLPILAEKTCRCNRGVCWKWGQIVASCWLFYDGKHGDSRDFSVKSSCSLWLFQNLVIPFTPDFRAYPLLFWTVIWDFGNATTTEQPYSRQMPKAGCPDKRWIRSSLKIIDEHTPVVNVACPSCSESPTWSTCIGNRHGVEQTIWLASPPAIHSITASTFLKVISRQWWFS